MITLRAEGLKLAVVGFSQGVEIWCTQMYSNGVTRDLGVDVAAIGVKDVPRIERTDVNGSGKCLREIAQEGRFTCETDWRVLL